jgi:hypothetical protein
MRRLIASLLAVAEIAIVTVLGRVAAESAIRPAPIGIIPVAIVALLGGLEHTIAAAGRHTPLRPADPAGLIEPAAHRSIVKRGSPDAAMRAPIASLCPIAPLSIEAIQRRFAAEGAIIATAIVGIPILAIVALLVDGEETVSALRGQNAAIGNRIRARSGLRQLPARATRCAEYEKKAEAEG